MLAGSQPWLTPPDDPFAASKHSPWLSNVDKAAGRAEILPAPLTYSRTRDRSVFMIDGRTFDGDRVDQTVKLSDTEEWTIVNTDQQYHTFRLHQTPFLVTEVNGLPQDEDSLRDTASIPPATGAGPGVLKVVILFTDPEMVGAYRLPPAPRGDASR
jgi:FtsP/CotA-like multicopper oxidase with cupredoxin domain